MASKAFVSKAVSDIVEAIRPCFRPDSQHLLPLLTSLLEGKDRELAGKDREIVAKDREIVAKDREIAEKEKRLQLETALRARMAVDLMAARGLNNTMGLFEYIQEELILSSGISRQQRRADLVWKDVLSCNDDLRQCIYRCTNVPEHATGRQAALCCGIYSTLSQHVHDGKSLAQLQVEQGGPVFFVRGRLSSQQVRVMECLGDAAHIKIEEQTTPRMAFWLAQTSGDDV